MENTILKSDWKKVMKTSSRSSFPVLLFCGFCYLFLELFAPFISKVLKKNGFILTENFDTMFGYILIYLVIFPIVILAFQLVSKKENRVSIKSGFCKPKKSFLWIVKWLVIAFSISTLVTALGGAFLFFISALTGVDVSGTNLFFASATLVTVPSYIADTIVPLLFAPIFEEILFRGVIYKNDEKLGCIFASVTSSLIFGFWHMTLSQIVLGSVLGFFSCYLYRKTESIFPSMILHFIVNLKSVIATLLLKSMGVTNISDYMSTAPDLMKNNMTQLMLMFVLLLFIGLLNLIGFALLVITIVNKKMEIKPNESVRIPMMKNEVEISEARYSEADMSEHSIIVEPEIKEEKMSGFKKALLYYSSPVTIVTYGVLIFGLVMRIL